MATVRFWAAARDAAGAPSAVIETATLHELRAELDARYGDRFAALLTRCQWLVDGELVGRQPADQELAVDSVVEVLPPFAGG